MVVEQFNFTTLLDVACKDVTETQLSNLMTVPRELPCPPETALAASLIQDLYSSNSKEASNVQRIIVKLDAASEKLAGLSWQLKETLRHSG